MSSNVDTSQKPVLYFDGECNLCTGVVQFIIRHDKKNLFLFASLQSSSGQRAVTELHYKLGNPPDSIILYSNGQYYLQSSAALHTARLLGGIWKIFYVAIIIPRFIRDMIYNVVARNRYKWFGRRPSCMVPGPGINERFLK